MLPHLIKDFDRAAKHYSKKATLHKEIAAQLSKKTLPYLAPNHYWLDIGCGTGFIGSHLSTKTNLLQLDASHKMAKQAASNGSSIQGNFMQPPFTKHTLDGIISNLALQWTYDFNILFREISFILKPSSMLIGSLFIQHSLQQLRAGIGQNRFHDMPNFEQILTCAQQHQFQVLESATTQHALQHGSVLEALQFIKAVGGANKSNTRQTPLSKKEISALESKHPNGIATDWHIGWFILEAPS